MLSWEVLDQSSRGYRKAIAAELGVSYSLVRRWTDRPEYLGGEGEWNPLSRVVQIVAALRRHGAPDADNIVKYLCAETGFLPPVRAFNVLTPEVIGEMGALFREIGEFVEVSGRSLEDGILTLTEEEAMVSEGRDVIAQMLRILSSLEIDIAAKQRTTLTESLPPHHVLKCA